MSADPHVQLALQYIDDVLEGRVPACLYVRQACARQRRDRERFADGTRYVWSDEEAGRACRFIELLPHVKGPRANRDELLRLEPWQCFIVTTVFGWRRADTGARRFRRVYLELPRGSGKSTLAAAVGLYGLCGEREQGAEIYAAATTRAQAKIVWGVARQMVKKARAVQARLGLRAGKDAIYHGKSDSAFTPMTRDADTQEGQNVHVAIADEFAVWPNRSLFDTLETATSKRPSSLLWCITTAGHDTAGIGYEVRSFAAAVLAGTLEDETQFGCIWSIDEGDDWAVESSWRKANPNYGVDGSVDPTNIRALAEKAIHVPSARATFQRKHLNVWVGGDETWLPLAQWDACGDASLRRGSFDSMRCWIGLDLASKTDLAARVLWFERTEQGGVRHLYCFAQFYLPAAAATASRNAQFAGWVEQGFIRTTPGDVLDFDYIKADIREDVRRHRVVAVGFDPWQATQLSVELLREGVPMVEVAQTMRKLSEPMKEFAALTLSRRLHHDANPVMRWMVSNVMRHEDPLTGSIKPTKERPELKIDGVVAALIGLNRLLSAPEVEDAPEPKPYASRGIRSLP